MTTQNGFRPLRHGAGDNAPAVPAKNGFPWRSLLITALIVGGALWASRFI